MHMPATDDTILATASAWRPSPVGIVRLSGPQAFELTADIGGPRDRPGAARHDAARIQIDDDLTLPATIFRFPAPRSYTAQDIAEIHTVGNLPALRALAAQLIARGARRALPGEFTARAFVFGKLDASQVAGVLALIHAHDADAARQAARVAGGGQRRLVEKLLDRVDELLAMVEAGIDFVEEEGIAFISPAALRAAATDLLNRAAGAAADRAQTAARAGIPHVALVGLPNAGKSTLFNALLGYERAIVSPVIGTTRDVLSAEIEFAGVRAVLQDCAGLGHTPDEIELAAHHAAERAADLADLVLWLHDARTPWNAAEIAACDRIPPQRRLLVLTKCDESERETPQAEARDMPAVRISARGGVGLAELRGEIARRLSGTAATELAPAHEQMELFSAALRRVTALADGSAPTLAAPELVALELRSAAESLGRLTSGNVVEDILGRIFTRFCIGK